jgi:hypothetical protein
VLDPAFGFKQRYLAVHDQIGDIFQDHAYSISMRERLNETLAKLTSFVEKSLMLLTQSPLFSGKAVHDTLDFFKSSQYKELCSDKMGVIWPSPSLSVAKESSQVGKFLKKNGYCHYLAQ